MSNEVNSRIPLWVKLTIVPSAWTVAHAPAFVRRSLCHVLGHGLYYLVPRRRHTTLSNLHHVFPEWSEEKRRRIARRSAVGTVEIGTFTFLAPFLSRKWLRSHIRLSESTVRFIEDFHRHPRPVVYLIPHVALSESLTTLPAVSRMPPGTNAYRELKQPGIEAYVRAARKRWGFEFLPRRIGLVALISRLRANQPVGLLFDQNAGPAGVAVL